MVASIGHTRAEDPVSYFNYFRMETKRRQRSVSAVTTRFTQWKRHESAGSRQLERHRNAMELRRNALVAVITP